MPVKYTLICVSKSRGLQQYTARLANALSKGGRRVCVVGQAELNELLALDVDRVPLCAGRYSLLNVFILIKILLGSDGILHYQGINIPTLLLFRVLSSFLRAGTIHTPHNVETHFPNRIYNLFKWGLWRTFDLTIVHTNGEVALIRSDLAAQTIVIPHGEYEPLNSDGVVSGDVKGVVASHERYIVAPGFIRDDKNLDFLIDNVSVIERRGYKLVVAGKNLSRLCSNYISLSAIHIDRLLSDEDLNYLIENSSAVILPYSRVSESGILHQSLSVGTPVLVSDIPGFNERVAEGVNGIFIRGLFADELDKSLDSLCAVEFDRCRIKSAHLEKYSWEAIASKLWEEIDERNLCD